MNVMNRRACYAYIVIREQHMRAIPRGTDHVFLTEPHLWHIRDEDGAKVLRDLDIVRRAHGLTAQVKEAKLRDRARALRHEDLAAPRVQLAVRYRRVGGVGCERAEELVNFGPVLWSERVVVDM